MSKSIIDSREQQLTELNNFTDAVNTEITDIIDHLGWSLKSVTDVDKGYLTCPYDPSHRFEERSLNDHLVSCQWKAEGYEKSDVPLSESTLPSDSPFSIKFDVRLQDEVLRKAKEQNSTMQIGMGERLIPQTSDRLLTDFTSDERRALYDYAVANTAKPDIGQDITDINDLKPQERENKELSRIDLLVQERNLKRRRAKHRGVHTNKKSQVEILREVINQQMEVYRDYVSQANSEHVTDVSSIKTEDSNSETQDKAEYFYKVNDASPQNYDNFNSTDKNGYHYKDKRNEKSYHRSRDRDRRERYTDEHDETYKRHKYSERRKSSHSRDRKSHKKNKHRSRDRHKRHEKKHKSRDRERSSERHHRKHSDHRQKGKSKEY